MDAIQEELITAALGSVTGRMVTKFVEGQNINVAGLDAKAITAIAEVGAGIYGFEKSTDPKVVGFSVGLFADGVGKVGDIVYDAFFKPKTTTPAKSGSPVVYRNSNTEFEPYHYYTNKPKVTAFSP